MNAQPSPPEPGTKPVYLDHASMGLPSPATLAAVADFIAHMTRPNGTGTERTLEMFTAVDHARQAAARLVHADPGCLLLVENTSRGLGLVADLLPLSAGDNVLVDDLEFMSAVLCWRGKTQSGVEVRPVRTCGGCVTPEDFARAADCNTRVLVVSAVQETTGFRCDLRAFSQLAAKLDAFLIVDGIQEAGVVPVDLGVTPVHAYCAGGHKWLRSPFGLGFLYLHPALLHRLPPAACGYLALQEPVGGWEAYLESPRRSPFDPLPVLPDARRFTTGGLPNFVGAVALHHSIAELQQLGQAGAWNSICALRRWLARGLQGVGAELRSAADEEHASGIVCFGLPSGIAAERRLLTELLRNNIYVSLRYVSGVGGIRVAIHYNNSMAELEALLNVVGNVIARQRAAVSGPTGSLV